VKHLLEGCRGLHLERKENSDFDRSKGKSSILAERMGRKWGKVRSNEFLGVY